MDAIAGVSKSLPDQLTEILNVVAVGLSRVATAHKSDKQRKVDREQRRREQETQSRIVAEKIDRGVWHDGRIDCVAGNGVMSELGVGDEPMDASEEVVPINRASTEAKEEKRENLSDTDLDAVNAMPIVVIRNYSSKIGATREELLAVLASWAASLVENQVRVATVWYEPHFDP
jgi:hypothetical protein